MFARLRRGSRKPRESGQALVEFALSAGVLLFVILGLLDFGSILFSYSQASGSLRDALRFAEIMGQIGGSGVTPYLDCTGMTEAANNNFFTATHSITIEYIKANNPAQIYTCATVSDSVLENGDILRIRIVASVDPFFLPFGTLDLNFEGRRSIVKILPIALEGGFGEGAAGSGITVPAPTGFEANEGDCSTGSVSFEWDPLSPIPTRMEIREVGTDALITYMGNVEPNLVTNAYCNDCDTINPIAGHRCYYAVSFVGATASPASNTDCVQCLVEPLTPINFGAEVNCTSGLVTFTWDHSDFIPTYVVLRSTDGMFEDTIAGDIECIDCDTIFPGQSRSYTITAYNSVPGTTLASAASAPVTRECLAGLTGEVLGYLKEAQNTSQFCSWKDNMPNGIVQLRLTNGTLVDERLSGPTGYFTFGNVPIGTYYLDVPATLGGRSKLSDNAGGTCHKDQTTVRFTISVTAGSTTSLTIGYY